MAHSGEPLSRHHHFTRCRTWAPWIRRLWKDVGKPCGWKHRRARLSGEGNGGGLGFPAGYQGRMYNDEPTVRGGGGQQVGRTEGWGGPALGCIFSPSSPILHCLLLSFVFSFTLYVSGWGAGDKVGPAMPVGDWTRSICKKPAAPAMALRATRSGI